MQIKGIALKNTKDWVIANHDLSEWDKIMEKLPDETRDYLSDGIFVSNWYPIQVFVDLNNNVAKTFGKGNDRIIFDIAKEGAKKNMKGIYRIFMKVASPAYVVRKATALFGQFYDFGSFNVVSTENGHYVVKWSGVPELKPVFQRIAGYIEGILDITNAKKPNVTYNYEHNGKKVVFDIRFEV